jgi:hypothetical protein
MVVLYCFLQDTYVLEMRLVESLQTAKMLRGGADYENTFDPESAKALVDQAEEFVKIAVEVVLGE